MYALSLTLSVLAIGMQTVQRVDALMHSRATCLIGVNASRTQGSKEIAGTNAAAMTRCPDCLKRFHMQQIDALFPFL